MAVDREWYLHRDADDRLRAQTLALLEALPSREPPARRHLARGAAQPGGPGAGARLRPAAGGARERGAGPERARPGPPRLARHPAEPGAGAGGEGARGRLPRCGGGAPGARGGPGPPRGEGHREARALPGAGLRPHAGAGKGVALLPRGGPAHRSGSAGGPAPRQEGDRPRRLQGPVRGQSQVRHPPHGVLRRSARDGARGRASGAPGRARAR